MKIVVQSRSSHFPLSRVSQRLRCLSCIVGILAAEIDRKGGRKRRTKKKRAPRFEPMSLSEPPFLASLLTAPKIHTRANLRQTWEQEEYLGRLLRE